jgi:hypothetical protein
MAVVSRGNKKIRVQSMFHRLKLVEAASTLNRYLKRPPLIMGVVSREK